MMRKLKTEWTEEQARDLQYYHSIDAEAELQALLGEHLAAEINKEIVASLLRTDIEKWWDKWSFKEATPYTFPIAKQDEMMYLLLG